LQVRDLYVIVAEIEPFFRRRRHDTVSHVEWLGEEAGAGCTERSFMLRRPVLVPGVLWSPRATVPQATVLLFHGGSGHKRSERHVQMGRWLASTPGLAVIAIDGPYHGDRVPAPMAPSAYQQLIADEGIERVTARMTADWLEAVSALADLGLADDAHVSVFGMSMGTRFGLPAAAAPGLRLQCAVLGKFGLRQAAPLHPRAPGTRPHDHGRACRLRTPALSRAVGRRDLPPGPPARSQSAHPRNGPHWPTPDCVDDCESSSSP
jgi:pimeloyl-ACP methyl ester carboxylesterase